MNKLDRAFLAVAALLLAGSPAYAQVVLNINQTNGQVQIVNTSVTNTVNINAYDIRSLQSSGLTNDGLLNVAGWASLQTSLGNGWLKTNFPSSELLLETNANNVLSLGPGASRSLGSAFTTNPAKIGAAQVLAGFGNEYRDVTFQYTDADNGSSITSGAVEYSNSVFNNLVLNVQLGTGKVHLVNESSVAVQIEAYRITSVAGSLNTGWNGLSDTVANWERNIGTSHALAELSKLNTSSNPGAPLAPLTINGGASFDLGTAFTVGGSQDLSFSFLLTSDTAGNGFAGEIRYIGLQGDFDLDGDVDGRDFLAWQRGQSPSPLSAVDLANWKSSYGVSAIGSMAAATTAVPEPSSVALGVLLVAGLYVRRQR